MNEQIETQQLRHLSPVEALAWLDAEVGRAGELWEEEANHAALPPAAIEVAENLFQPRAIAEWHLTGFVAAVKSKRTLRCCRGSGWNSRAA